MCAGLFVDVYFSKKSFPHWSEDVRIGGSGWGFVCVGGVFCTGGSLDCAVMGWKEVGLRLTSPSFQRLRKVGPEKHGLIQQNPFCLLEENRQGPSLGLLLALMPGIFQSGCGTIGTTNIAMAKAF